ncbi:unnamed protein product [Lupinus luteus]|uniref:Uncharacterized protein n=1 Tax=Lupinus luteus TaxID=3873 RepID=A0AAV1XQD3_LUPLU
MVIHDVKKFEWCRFKINNTNVEIKYGPHIPVFDLSVLERIPTRCNVHVGEELHHNGWNSCSYCRGDPSAQHQFLTTPALF